MTASPILSLSHPRIGMIATVRHRRGVIASVEPYNSPAEGRLHLVRCAPHAEKIGAQLGGQRDTASRVSESPTPPYSTGALDLFGKELSTDLFGEAVASPKRRKR